MLDRRDCLATQRWLNAAVGIGYAVALLAGAAAGFQSHRWPRPAHAPQARSAPAEGDARALVASAR